MSVMVIAKWLTTAGGRIACHRCVALSTRTKLQCGRPALKTSKTNKCQFHGGRSSGPKTQLGRERIAIANTRHGRETRALQAKRSSRMVDLRLLEDVMHVISMTSATTVGRKPNGYEPIRSLEDAYRLMMTPRTRKE